MAVPRASRCARWGVSGVVVAKQGPAGRLVVVLGPGNEADLINISGVAERSRSLQASSCLVWQEIRSLHADGRQDEQGSVSSLQGPLGVGPL